MIYVCTYMLFLVLEILFYQVREWKLVVEHFSCFPDWISSNRLKNKVMLCTFGIKKKHLLRFSMKSKSINQVSVTVQFLVRSHWENESRKLSCFVVATRLYFWASSPLLNEILLLSVLPFPEITQVNLFLYRKHIHGMLAVHFVRNDWIILHHHHINLGRYMRWTTIQAEESNNWKEH